MTYHRPVNTSASEVQAISASDRRKIAHLRRDFDYALSLSEEEYRRLAYLRDLIDAQPMIQKLEQEFQEAQRELRRAFWRRAHARKRFMRYTPAEFQALVARTGNRCLCCGRSGQEVALVGDHIVPLSLGGLNLIDNIQPLCRACNQHKGTQIIDYRP